MLKRRQEKGRNSPDALHKERKKNPEGTNIEFLGRVPH